MRLIHVHFMQSQFFASCAQTRRRRKRNKTQASHAQLSSPWPSHIKTKQHPRTLSEESPHGHPESKQITVQHSHFQKAVCKERNYAAHMHKQKAAFVRLGRSLGIFSLKCKSTLQRCPKKVTIIISISSIFRHVHVLHSCTQFMFMQSQFFASCAQTRRRRKRNKTQARHAQLSSPWPSHIKTQQHPRTLSEESPHGHPESKQITVQHSHFQKAVCKERNYAAHMHKQNVAFVRLGRSLGIFSLKCKSTLQRCPKKVTIIISISSIFRHVHVLHSCTQFMFMQSQFFASCAQTRRRRKRNKTQASHAQLSSPWPSHIKAQQHPRTLSEESPHGHPESKQITVQHSHFQKAVCKGTELHSTHTQTACSFRQTGAVTWHLLTEMQKHSPKVS